MNPPPFPKGSSFHSRLLPGGYALVLVLSILVLLIGVVVGFLTLAGSERSSARGALDAVEARILAENAVGLVQTQINRATARAATHPWISQPGMARMFNPDGSLLAAYKLYSANNMIAASVNKAEDRPAAAWFDDPAVWVDLNRPVAVDDPANPGARISLHPIASPNPGVEAGSFTVSGAPVQAGTGANPLPMPVRWLYVLEDGSFVAPTGSGNNASVPGETADNPIVGRVAFWTDDDSCKVNINTASEGTFWDTPRTNTTIEFNLADSQPTEGEFQRYPGHPGMLSLSTVFPSLSAAELQRIAPATNPGGSNGGTTPVTSSSKVPLSTDRLLPSVDELLFRPTGTATARDREVSLTPSEVQQKQFFLTASSRAPEVNLFGMPRIAIWPVHRNLDPARTTAFDRLIAHCATVAAGDKTSPTRYPYYFQRENSADATNDISIPRNVRLLEYLTALSNRPVPGFTGSLATKYNFAGERDQILTQIFDYIRCANLTDAKLGSNSFTPYFDASGNPLPGANQVAQSVRGATRGLGRTQVLSELAIAFICTADGDVPASNTHPRPGNPDALPAGQQRVQAILLPEFFSVAAGFAGMANEFAITIEGADSLQLDGKPLGFPSNDSITYNTPPSNLGGSNVGGTTDWRYALSQRETDYPFLSNPIVIDKTNATPSFSGGNVTVTLRTRGAVSSNQTIHMVLPGTNVPRPTLGSDDATYPGRWWDFLGTNKRIDLVAKDLSLGLGLFIRFNNDTVRSVVPRGGDMRLVAARSLIDDRAASSVDRRFVPHPSYTTTGTRLAALLANSRSHNTSISFLDPQRTFISALTMSQRSQPDFLPGLIASGMPSPESTGDFDTGVGYMTDGSYINKPDEGSVRKTLDPLQNSYFGAWFRTLQPDDTFFSPNRQMPSPVMFGSLPTGVMEAVPWRTLLFRPQISHPSHSTTYPDHLLLDLFWMPVVEPYAISDPFSTAGKINMNYEILPFTYLDRPTALHALLKSERVTAVPDSAAATYKATTPDSSYSIRLPINIAGTLDQFKDQFAGTRGAFLSASEICDLHIVPQGETPATMASFWNTHRLTGDNLKERVYANLYPRLTTRSNTFTVHVIAQSLRRGASFTPGQWTETPGAVSAEYRGSTTIERFLPDVLSATTGGDLFEDYADNSSRLFGGTAPPPLDDFYRWRTLRTNQFAP